MRNNTFKYYGDIVAITENNFIDGKIDLSNALHIENDVFKITQIFIDDTYDKPGCHWQPQFIKCGECYFEFDKIGVYPTINIEFWEKLKNAKSEDKALTYVWFCKARNSTYIFRAITQNICDLDEKEQTITIMIRQIGKYDYLQGNIFEQSEAINGTT